jgi:hypothetical protein
MELIPDSGVQVALGELETLRNSSMSRSGYLFSSNSGSHTVSVEDSRQHASCPITPHPLFISLSASPSRSQIVPKRIIIITIPSLHPLPNPLRPSREPLLSFLIDMAQSQNMSDDEQHSQRRETDRDARTIEVAWSRRGGENLPDDQARAVANAEDDAESGRALVVTGEIAVEPDDAEAGL